MVIMGASHPSFQSEMFWGLIPQVLRVKMLNVRFQHFTLQGAALNFEFPPDSGFLHQGWGFASSTCFDVGFFSPFAQCVAVTQLVLGGFSLQGKFFYM